MPQSERAKGTRQSNVTFKLPASGGEDKPNVANRSINSGNVIWRNLTTSAQNGSLDGTPTSTTKKGKSQDTQHAAATSSSRARVWKHDQTAKLDRESSTAFTSDLFPPTKSARRPTRLPWLDGNQSRHNNVPKIPGAFVDEEPSRVDEHSLGSSKNAAPRQRQPSRGWSYDLSTGADATVSPQSGSVAESSATSDDSRTKVAAVKAALPSTPALDRQLSHTTARRIVSRTMQAPVDDFNSSRPAVPLVTLARQLHVSDTTATSDTTASSLDRSRRHSDSSVSTTKRSQTPAPIAMPQPLRSVKPPVVTTPGVHDTMHAGPEYSNPAEVSEPLPATYEDFARRPSFALQPLRADKLSPPESSTKEHRERAMSVQPISAKTWKELPLASAERPYDHPQTTTPPTAPTGENTAHSLRLAVQGLEHLMQEALHLARQAAEQDKPDEVPGILQGASAAIRNATNVPLDQGRSVVRADSVSTSSSTTSGSYDLNPILPPTAHASVDRRASTLHSGASTRSAHAPPIPAALTQPRVRTVWDEEWPNHRIGSDATGPLTAPITRENVPSVRDWAHTGDHPIEQPARKPVMLQKNVQLPAEPPAAQPSNRQHFNLVNRGASRQPALHAEASDGTPLIPPRRSSLPANVTARTGRNRNADEAESPLHGSSTALPTSPPAGPIATQSQQWGADKFDEKDYESYDDSLKGKYHIVLPDGQDFTLGYKPQPIARNWGILKKRWTAWVTCLNTALIGILIGIYAGEVPAIQYTLADRHHRVILGNVVLYLAIGLVVLIFWPLPLLHGRKPYALTGLAVALPLQIPQAVIVGTQRGTNYSGYLAGLLVCRALTGAALGFVHINLISTLLDLYGASLQSDKPHGEIVVLDDVRRHGGGIGLWLGFWSFCWIGSLAVGFLIGAEVVSGIDLSWGFYISVILIAVMLMLTLITPETRRRPHRRTMQEVELPNDTISRRVARGEVKMHVYGTGPKWWWEEVFAGLYLTYRMLAQTGFLVMTVYLAWIYAQIVLIIVLLGNLLSKYYRWRPEYVGLGVFSVAIGALLAIPSSKANIFSKSRQHGPRTDSMTMQPRFSWSSHFIRRLIFMTALPVAGLAYTLCSRGASVQYMAPIIFAALIGYISNLAISECNGIIMETFDTSDLQPGANSRHRLQSLSPEIKRKRTSYSSYPRVSAGLFATQALGYMLAAASTGIGGAVTRRVGAQKATAITAGILLGLTIVLTFALVRYKTIQVIPNELFGQYFGSTARRESNSSVVSEGSWRAVVIGNPSGKVRRMSWLELGSLSRWTEIRRLNRLLNRSTTQALNPGWQ